MRGDRTEPSAEPNLPDEMLDRLSEDEEYRRYVSEVIDLQGLLEHPGWYALQEHFKRGAENFERSVTARLMQGEQVSQREIDFLRGAKAVSEEIFARPVAAVKDLERTARRMYERQAQAEVDAERVSSPYTLDKE